jgi:hypothetical protein
MHVLSIKEKKMFCLRHPANAECFDQGGRSKPACVQPGCKGKHAAGVYELLGGTDASVNLVAEEDDEEDDEDLYINVARVGQEEDNWQEPDDSWLDLDVGESNGEAGVYCISACMRKDDSQHHPHQRGGGRCGGQVVVSGARWIAIRRRR